MIYVKIILIIRKSNLQAAKTDKNLHNNDVIFEDIPDDSYSKFHIVLNE